MITGALSSLTVIFCTQVAVLPQASVAVHVRVMVPKPHASNVPASEKVTTGGKQLSVAVALPGSPILQSKLISAGQVITGFSVSTISTCWLHGGMVKPLAGFMVSITLYAAVPQVAPAFTSTHTPLVAPTIVALPETLHS